MDWDKMRFVRERVTAVLRRAKKEGKTLGRRFLSLRSLIFASCTVCHCIFDGTSAPRHLERYYVINDESLPSFWIACPPHEVGSCRGAALDLAIAAPWSAPSQIS